MELDLSALRSATDSLEEAISYFQNLPQGIDAAIVRDSVIQRFEYTYELAWKLIQRWIKHNVSPEDAEPRTKKDLFRLAARKKLISEPEDWFDFTEARNTVAHTYNEKNADYVFSMATRFLPVVQQLLVILQKHND